MKPANEGDVIYAYYKYALYLILTVCVTVLSFWFFLRTNAAEMQKIDLLTNQYEEINKKTIDMVNAMDSLENYLNIQNSGLGIDNYRVSSIISTKKMTLKKTLEKMDEKDGLIYSKVVKDVDNLQHIKDSISDAIMQEDLARNELQKSLKENKRAMKDSALRGMK
jgi:hypothetical protein